MSAFINNTHLLDDQGYIFGCGQDYKGYKLGKSKLQNNSDISENIIQTNESVFEISDNFLIKTNYFNIWDYFLNEYKTIPKTIHLSTDGSVLVQKFILNEEFISYQDDLNDKFLSVEFENIFDGKYEKQFNEIREIGSGSYGKVFEVKNRFNDKVFAIKTFKTESKFI